MWDGWMMESVTNYICMVDSGCVGGSDIIGTAIHNNSYGIKYIWFIIYMYMDRWKVAGTR